MAAEITGTFPDAEVKLIPGSGGIFEVAVDGTLVFSKKQAGRHVEPGEIVHLMRPWKG